SIPERPRLARRHQRCRLFGRRQRRELLRHRGVDAVATERRNFGTDATVQKQYAIDLRDRRSLFDPLGVVTFRTERLAQLDHAERQLLHELLAIGGSVELASLALGALFGLL